MDLFAKNTFLIVLAVGMTFVILTGGIDLSVGAVMALGSVIAATLLQQGWPAILVIPVVLGGRLGMGLLVGLMIDRFNIQPFIASLAAMFLARGLCLVITDRSIDINDAFFSRDEPGPHQSVGGHGDQLARVAVRDSSRSTRPGRWSSRWWCWPSRSSCCTTPGSAGPSTRSAAASPRPA